MRREDKFVMSHSPYAVDMSSLGTWQETRKDGSHFYYCTANAVWFRKKNGVTYVCDGCLWNYQDKKPETVEQFLLAYIDGRYGGESLGRWDGERYYGAQEPEIIAKHLEILRPALYNFPAIPLGYDGWWTFK